MSLLVHSIYVSTATRLLNSFELSDLLLSARLNNSRLGISGVLLYMNGRFFQVLEGERDEVTSMYKTIERDTRHKEITQIVFEAISARNFPSWSMGLVDMSGDKLHQIATLSDPMNGGSSLVMLPNCRAKKLLLAFCEGRWGLTGADLTLAERR